jgi:hypothetical protein
MTMAEVRKQAADEVLRKLIAQGCGVDAAGRRAIERRVEAAVERATAKRHVDDVVDIRKRIEMESPVAKIDRSHRVGATLRETIAAYAAKHGVSKSVAADMVLLSPVTSEYVRLDKQMREVERGIRLDKLEGTVVNTNPASRQTPSSAPPVMRPSEAGPVSGSDAPAATRSDEAMTADDVLQRLADVQQHKNPAMSRARAVSVAANDPAFTEAHRHEKMRKGL